MKNELIPYKAGSVTRYLPDIAKNFREVDFESLSIRTKANLNQLKEMGFDWLSVWCYDIGQKHIPLSKNMKIFSTTKEKINYKLRHGYVIYGKLKDTEVDVTYFRKESRSPMAGQTYLFIGPIQLSATAVIESNIRLIFEEPKFIKLLKFLEDYSCPFLNHLLKIKLLKS